MHSTPVLEIFFILDDQQDPRPFSGFNAVMKTLADRLIPLVCEINFNGMGIGQAVAPGSIGKHYLNPAGTPLVPVPAF